MTKPMGYRVACAESRYPRVVDDNGQWLCDGASQATAELIARALTHLAAHEEEHNPLTAEEWERLTRALEEFNRQYLAEHPDFDPDRLARALGMK